MNKIETLTFEKFWTNARNSAFNKDEFGREHKIPKETLHVYKSIARATWEVAYLVGKNEGFDLGYREGVLATTAKQGMIKSRLMRFWMGVERIIKKI